MVEGECCVGEAGCRMILLLLSCGAGEVTSRKLSHSIASVEGEGTRERSGTCGGVIGIGRSSGVNGLGGGVLGEVGGVDGAVRIGIFCVDAVANGGGIGCTGVGDVGAGGYGEGAGGEGGLGGGAIG